MIRKGLAMTYRCVDCNEEHEGLPDIGMDYPDPYLAVPEGERAERTKSTLDRCIVRDEDGEHYFVRGVLMIPVRGQEQSFGIGLWVSQSRKNFERYEANEDMEPTYGWVVNRIGAYAETTYLLKARLTFQNGDGLRPLVELEPTDHPLAVEQREGITLERAWEIVHHYTKARTLH